MDKLYGELGRNVNIVLDRGVIFASSSTSNSADGTRSLPAVYFDYMLRRQEAVGVLKARCSQAETGWELVS